MHIPPCPEPSRCHTYPDPFFPLSRVQSSRARRREFWNIDQQRTKTGDTRERFARIRHSLGKLHPTPWNLLSGPELTGPSRMGPPRVRFVQRPKAIQVPCSVVASEWLVVVEDCVDGSA